MSVGEMDEIHLQTKQKIVPLCLFNSKDPAIHSGNMGSVEAQISHNTTPG